MAILNTFAVFDNGFTLAFGWLSNNFTTIIFIIFIGMLTVLVARNLDNFMERYFQRASHKLHMEVTTLRMFKHLTVAIVYFLGIITVIFSIPSLQSLSVALFTGAGVLGIVVGLAAQSTLSNIIAGLSLAVYQPFRVGDRLDIMNEYGKVTDLNLRHTVIITWDNRRLIIPNSKISDEAIINWTIEDPAIIWSIDVGIGYDSDIHKARKIMIEEARNHPNVMPQHNVDDDMSCVKDSEPCNTNVFNKALIHSIDSDFRDRGDVNVRVTDLQASAINLRLQMWFNDRSVAHSSSCDIREAIVTRFAEEGIEIPYQHMVVVQK